MKRLLNISAITAFAVTLLLTFGIESAAATKWGTPKREFRSAWVATVWALDWPEGMGYGTNAETKQKAQIDKLLDSLKNNNFNAINFQVRGMCDAMYESSYEPWSSYITGTRGQRPTYDPLAYVVNACHQRGMECHAWVNPYRFSSNGIDQWNTTQDQALKNNGMLLQEGIYVVLDPAKQETIDRIVNVCREIITNYDVDGILYDDYFYPSGIPTDATAGDYTEWQNSGTTMSIGDWRRDNVNRMVAAVYNMIQQTRPEVRFGISPAGVTCRSADRAAQYGVDPCPAGSDWQYNDIFSDPLAWYAAGTIDYMSPQVYWHIGATADFGKITPWWGTVAQRFGRHVYISESISELNNKSDEAALLEFAKEVELCRTSSLDNAPGSIFYSAKYLYRTGSKEELGTYLGRNNFSRPAIPPAMEWKPGNDPGVVAGLARTETTLSWNAINGYKYAVYAVPNSVAPAAFDRDGEFLLDISYSSSYTIPAQYRYGYYFAVTALDRTNNEFSAAILPPVSSPVLPAPAQVSPDNGELVTDPFTMTWQPVSGAQGYMVEMSSTPDFSSDVRRCSTTGTSISSSAFGDFMPNVYYWRVSACATGWADGMSEVRSCSPLVFMITYPANGDTDIPPAFNAQWLTAGTTNPATLEIATDPDFETVVFSGTATNGHLVVPAYTLMCGTIYYMRVSMNDNGVEKQTNTVTFTTSFLVAEPPTLQLPVDGGTLYADQHPAVARQQAAQSYVIEISTSKTTWGRTRFMETLRDFAYQTTLPAAEIKVNSKLMVDGTTYYARAKATYLTENGSNSSTAYGPIVSFVYSSSDAPLRPYGDVNGDGEVTVGDVSAIYSIILGLSEEYIEYADVNGDGEVTVGDVSAIYGVILGI